MDIFDFNKGFNDKPISHFEPRARIAISANIIDENSALHFAYTKAIIDAGGAPVIIPVSDSEQALISSLDGIDGVLLSGGADIDARYFGEENLEGLTSVSAQRDYYEFILLRAALDRAIPIFGICRGVQLLNVALGGDLYQDLPSMYEGELLQHSVLENKHLAVHQVQITPLSQLHKIIGESLVGVNSRHHQAVRHVAPSLRVNARSTDGVIEGVEGYPERKILGVQWHPENMATDGDNAQMQRLFKFFIDEATLFKTAKKIHRENPIIDSHCDTPMLYQTVGFDLSKRNSEAKVDIIKMREGHLDTTITVAYIPQSTPHSEATRYAIDTLERFSDDVSRHADNIIIAHEPEQILSAKAKGLRSVVLGIENGLAIGEDLNNIDMFYNMGVRYITLCHNGTNQICDSAKGESEHDGLSDFGRAAIQRMNSLGVIVDVSHSSHKSTMDAAQFSSKPIIASHSSAKALCDHPRNLSDDAIRAIAATGGVVQVCAYAGFLSEKHTPTIIDIVEHIEYIVELVGEDHVGIGSDFDGDGGVAGFDGANEFISLTVELLRKGHSHQRVAKIMGGNIFRVLTNR